MLWLGIVLLGQAAAFVTEQPPYLKKCYVKSDDANDCLAKQLENILVEFRNGNRELGIQPLDPMKIERMAILQDSSGPVNINTTLFDIKVKGVANSKVVSSVLSNADNTLRSHLHTPHLRIDSNYTVSGRILVIPIEGVGDSWIEAENVDSRPTLHYEIRKKDGFHFADIKKIDVKLTIGNLKIRLNNLYNGLQALEESTNQYINENWQVVTDSMLPDLEKAIGEILLDLTKRVFKNVPLEFFIGDLENFLV